MTIAELTFRLMKDKALQRQMLTDPRHALELTQEEMTNEEVDFLCSMPWDVLLSAPSLNQPLNFGPGWWLCQPRRSTQPI